MAESHFKNILPPKRFRSTLLHKPDDCISTMGFASRYNRRLAKEYFSLKDVQYSFVVALCALMLLWVSLSGYFNALQLGLGVVSVIAVTWLTVHLEIPTLDRSRLKLMIRLPRYLLWLTREILVSNMLVAKIILSPNMPLKRTMIYSKPKQHSDLSVTIYANSITLTPGTVTVDVNDDGLAVHALSQRIADDLMSDQMNIQVARLEDKL
jgi:multicomponent Na+:H+ antiporter subunit E